MVKIIEREDGLYEDKGGFFVKIQKQDDDIKQFATPAFCPGCTHLMMNIDSRWFAKWGVCLNCSIEYFEDRLPIETLKTMKDRQDYVKEKKSLQKK